MCYVHVTDDEVNAAATREAAEASGLPIETRSYRAPMPDGDCQKVLFDLDCVPPESRAKVLDHLCNGGLCFKAAVHCHYLSDEQEAALTARRIKVFLRLDYNEVIAFFNGR